MKFISKPTVIEAEQFTDPDNPPKGVTAHTSICGDRRCIVTTINGHDVPVNLGDWIITEPDGVHHYPCDPKVFAARYDPLGEEITEATILDEKHDVVSDSWKQVAHALDETTKLVEQLNNAFGIDHWTLTGRDRSYRIRFYVPTRHYRPVFMSAGETPQEAMKVALKEITAMKATDSSP